LAWFTIPGEDAVADDLVAAILVLPFAEHA
jgi:hypothetical protein